MSEAMARARVLWGGFSCRWGLWLRVRPVDTAATSGENEDTPGARRLLPALNRSRSGRPQVPSSRRVFGL